MMMFPLRLALLLVMHSSTAFTAVQEQRQLRSLAQLSASIDETTPAPEQTYGETSRKYRRTFYTHNDWLNHRSDDRFMRLVLSAADSGVVRQLSTAVGFVVGTAAFVVLWNALLVEGYVDFSGLHHAALLPNLQLMELPYEPFTLSTPALGLLLVFKTDSSYGRWDEARKAWGSIVNHSSNIARMGASWISEETEPDPAKRRAALERLSITIWSFSRSLQRHLLGSIEDQCAYCEAVRERLPPKMAQGLIDARHKPSRALFELSNAINDLPMTYLRRIEIDRSCVEFANAMGACDRIFSSPVPLKYTRHTSRFLSGWMLGLPLGLWSSFDSTWNHIGLIPTCAVISFFFFGIDELAIQLEEPFSILPLQNMTDRIGLSAEEHVEWHFELDSNEYPGRRTPFD